MAPVAITMENAKSVIEVLRKQAREKAEKIISDAEKRAGNIVREAEERWKKIAEEEKKKIIDKARTEAQAILSEARREAKLEIARARNEVIEEVFRKAKESIRKKVDIEESLRNLFADAARQLDNIARVYVNPEDENAIRKILKEMKIKDVEIIKIDSILGGVIVEDKDGVRIDNSYNTRFERARESLLNKLAEILWGV